MQFFFIHGAGGCPAIWDQIKLDKQKFQSHYIDYADKNDESIADYSEYVETCILEHLKQTQDPSVILCGHSMGGIICLEIFLRNKIQINKIIFINTAARLKVNPLFLKSLKKNSNNYMQIADKIVDFSIDSKNKAAKNKLKMLFKKNNQQSLYAQLKACDKTDYREQLQKIHIPCLIIAGRSDQLTPPKFAQELHSGLKNSQIVNLKFCGHYAALEKAPEVQKHIQDFCKS